MECKPVPTRLEAKLVGTIFSKKTGLNLGALRLVGADRCVLLVRKYNASVLQTETAAYREFKI